MLIGEYIHTVDEKNRVSLPAKFRKEMGKNVVISPGLDSCLFVWTSVEWEKVSRRLIDNYGDLSFLSADQRSFNRNMFGQASEAEVDSIGRILVPDFLKDKIKLGAKAALVGVKDRIEIWNAPAWKEYKKKAEKEAEALAEKLSHAHTGSFK